jgi:prevent-host-death family protein
MKTVGIRELKQNPSKVIAEVKEGMSLTITERGRPVARIVPLTAVGLRALVEAGLARSPLTSPTSIGAPLTMQAGEKSPSQALRELREQERY